MPSRAAGSGRTAARVLLGLLLEAFILAGPMLRSLDDRIERRRVKRINAKGIDRDPVRSSHGHFVTASGLRWLSLCCWSPVLGGWVLGVAPSDGSCSLGAVLPRRRAVRQEAHRLGQQLVFWAHRRIPERQLVLVTGSSFSALEFLAPCFVRRSPASPALRLDTALDQPALPRRPGTRWRPEPKVSVR